MRSTSNKKEWILDQAGNLLGMSLGYEGCAEHEEGTEPLNAAFGVNLPVCPVGIADRKITMCPARLSFVEYDYQPRDKRRKSVKAASLLLRDSSYDREEFPHQQLLKLLDLGFYTDFGRPGALPQDDMICAWDKRDFGVNVRGADNIEKLRKMYEAMLAIDVALCRPTSKGFLRSGLTFVIYSAVPEDVQAVVTNEDLAHKRLHTAVEASGIHKLLKDAGIRWYALSPDWYDRNKEEGLIFFLNPNDQRHCNHGWFNLDELKQWIERKGPIMKDPKLEEFAELRRDWHYNLVVGLQAQGVNVRHHVWLEWMDEAKTKVGIRIRPAVGSEDRLPEGLYPFEETVAKYAKVPEPA